MTLSRYLPQKAPVDGKNVFNYNIFFSGGRYFSVLTQQLLVNIRDI
jgi:hypothetical protein